ncbi:MAG: hypothetical protein BWY50_02129 [Spirochaetes bacterium ADurb.Bin315]|nr:MAG: hypothetical protein BWY50_02129 [Spirochaetes bacterium ADurb.Bin315]
MLQLFHLLDELVVGSQKWQRGLPLLGVAQYDRAAHLIEPGYAKFNDRRIPADSFTLFNLIFNRKAVTIPSEAAIHPSSFHRLISRNRVFDRPGHNVAEMRKTGGKRRSIIEDILFLFRSVFNRLFEDIPLFPKLKNLFFHLWKIYFRINRTKHICSSPRSGFVYQCHSIHSS